MNEYKCIGKGMILDVIKARGRYLGDAEIMNSMDKTALDQIVGYKRALDSIAEDVENIPPVNVQPVVDTDNMATASDEFICKKCGIYLKDYIKVVLDEDNDGYIDEQHYEYEPKFCPECGAKVKGGE